MSKAVLLCWVEPQCKIKTNLDYWIGPCLTQHHAEHPLLTETHG